MLMFKKKNKQKEKEKAFELFSIYDQLAPSIFEEERDYIQVGEGLERTLCITDYPSIAEMGWLSKLYRLEGNISFTFHIEPTSSSEMIKHLSGSIQELESRLVSGRLTPEMQQRANFEKESAEELLKKLISNDSGGMIYVHFLIRIYAETLDELNKLTNRVKNTLATKNLHGYIPTSRMQDAFFSHLPTLDHRLDDYTRRNMDSKAFATMFPFDETELFAKDGVAIGKNVKTKSLIQINKWELSNRNGVILGQSGYGKTVTAKTFLLRDYMDGIRIFIIDPEDEYSDMVRWLDGEVIELSNTTDTIINPLQVFFERDEEGGSPLLQHVERLKVFFKLMRPTMTIDELAILDSYLMELYASEKFNINFKTNFFNLKPKDYPTLGDLYEYIMKKIKEDETQLEMFSYVLKQYVEGANKMIFNGHTNVNLNSNIISFNIKKLGVGSQLQVCAMYNAITFLWDEITKDKEKKSLFLDEVHVLADPNTPQSMELVYQIYKRIRKYGGGAWSATQQVEDFLNATDGQRNYGGAVIENSLMKMLLPLEGKSLNDLVTKAQIKLSDEELKILKPRKKNKGQGLFLYADKRVHLQIEPTETEWEFIGGKPEVKEGISV